MRAWGLHGADREPGTVTGTCGLRGPCEAAAFVGSSRGCVFQRNPDDSDGSWEPGPWLLPA